MSEIRATTISDAAGTGPIALTGQSAAKAWINYDRATSTSIEGSFNIASITDLGTGNQSTSFTSAFSNGRYSATGTCFGIGNVAWQSALLASSLNVQTAYTVSGGLLDYEYVCVSAHGDLA